jgi:hypothetical protein
MTKWGEVTRSETPIDWKRILERTALTPERFNNFLSQLIEERKTTMQEDEKDKDDIVDMDEESKSDEILDETEPDEDEDEEPTDEEEK